MFYNINQLRLVKEFKCLGADCEDTCCQGWGMQVNKSCVQKYKDEYPELLKDVVSGEAEYIMRRNSETDFCVRYKNGLCTIHKEKGELFLGDACNFYPRITRKYGDEYIMSAALSCPEIVRKAFFDENPFEFVESTLDRIPEEIVDYLPKELENKELAGEEAIKIIMEILKFVENDSKSPDRVMSCLISVFISLKSIDIKTWSEAIPFYLKMSENRLLPVEADEFDMCNLVLFLSALIYSSKKQKDRKLNEITELLENALGIEINSQTLEMSIKNGNSTNTKKIITKWKKNDNEKIRKILRKYIISQILLSGYPFSGLGKDMLERAMIFSVRYALFKLMIMSYLYCNDNLPNDKEIVRMTYRLSRFVDHIADSTLSINLYNQAGWNSEGKLRAIIGDL